MPSIHRTMDYRLRVSEGKLLLERRSIPFEFHDGEKVQAGDPIWEASSEIPVCELIPLMPQSTLLDRPILDLRLPHQIENRLMNNHISTIRELTRETPVGLRRLRNMGEGSVYKIIDRLSKHGLTLGMGKPPESYPWHMR